MPNMSLYTFTRNAAQDAGPFFQSSINHGSGSWAFVTMFNLPESHSALVWERPDLEAVLDLSATANSPLALAQIDTLLTSPASRSGPIRSSYIVWGNVPSVVRDPDPGLHQDSDLLLTLNIDFHVSTPWYCSDANGTLKFYIFPFLDDVGNLMAHVDGASFHFDGGGPFCSGDIQSAIQAGLSGAVASLQNLLDTALPIFAAGRTFNMLYILPGHGDFGFTQDNADNNASLAAVANG